MFVLEVELDGELHDSVSLFVDRGAEGRVRLGDIACSVLRVAKVEIVSVKGPQRMVQPVVAVDPELQALVLGDGKVLEQAHVPAEEGRSVNRG